MKRLFQGVKAIPWEEWLGKDAAFPVKGKSVKSLLHSVPDCQAIIKKAIVERLRGKYPGVGWFEERGPVYGVEFKLTKDLVTVVLDTTGEGLHKRGWRKLGSSAPLKETLASVLLTLSNWRPDQPLVDPFCGSGTIPIEAALKAMNVAPGLNRSFVCGELVPNAESFMEPAAGGGQGSGYPSAKAAISRVMISMKKYFPWLVIMQKRPVWPTRFIFSAGMWQSLKAPGNMEQL